MTQSNSRPGERPRNIPTLDGWRTIAILLVVAHHFGTGFYTSSSEYWTHASTRFGVVGVPIFFAISGLLICKLLLEEHHSSGSISLRSFYTRRIFRILPPLFAFLIIAAVLGLIKGPREFLSSVFFFRNYVSEPPAGTYTAHLWSLSVEEHFYLLWPTLLGLLLLTRRPGIYTAILAASIGMWRVVDFHTHLTARFVPILNSAMRTDLRLDALLWGCVAAFVLQDDRSRALIERWLRPAIFAAAAGIFVVIQIRPLFLQTLWEPMVMPLMLLGTVSHPQWLASRLLDLAPVRWIGRISYSLYLWQQMFLVPGWEPRPLPMIQTWYVSIPLAFLAATASYYLVERPFMALGRKLAARVISVRQPAESAQIPAVGSLR